jgi:hypothetical protein
MPSELTPGVEAVAVDVAHARHHPPSVEKDYRDAAVGELLRAVFQLVGGERYSRLTAAGAQLLRESRAGALAVENQRGLHIARQKGLRDAA